MKVPLNVLLLVRPTVLSSSLPILPVFIFFCTAFPVLLAPHYLVAEEKVHLCTNAPVTGYNDPIKCLQAVHTYSKNFQNAPKRALGYFQENLQLDSEWTSRALLVSMCSFSDSQDPLAAAECYKSVPTSLQHGTLVSVALVSRSHL